MPSDGRHREQSNAVDTSRTLKGRRRALMGRLLLAGARDPWVLLLAGLGAGGSWAVGLPAAAVAAVGGGMVAVGATAVALSGETEPTPSDGSPPRLVRGTPQAELLSALDGYVADLGAMRSTRQPDAVVDHVAEAYAAAVDTRSMALTNAAAIDSLDAAIERVESVGQRWSGSRSGAAQHISASRRRMHQRRARMLENLERAVAGIATVYTKLLEVSAEVSTLALSDGSVVDLQVIDESLETLRSAVAALEADQRKDPLAELG